MEDDLKKNKKNGRRPKKNKIKKMEDDLKRKRKKRQPPQKRPKQKWKTNQSTKINLIGCDTIENSPSFPSFFVGKLSHSLCRKGILFII